MYWKTDTIEIPGWDRTSLLEKVLRFEPEQHRELGEDMVAYCRFYGLDLWVEYPGVEYHQGYVNAERHQVMVHYFRLPASGRDDKKNGSGANSSQTSKGTVFIFHGYFDHVGLYSQLIERCLGEGFDVVAYDQPGHGLSSGTPAAIGSFLEYQAVLADVMKSVRGKVRGPWFAVGQSTGGAILIDYLLSNHHTFETSDFTKVVLLSPLVRPAGWLKAKVLHSIMKPFVSRWRRVFATNSSNSRFLEFLKVHDPLQARAVHVDWVAALRRWVPHIESARPVDFPITVIQGEKDTTVDWRHNLRIIRNKFSSVEELLIPDGRHHLVNEAKDLQATVFNTVVDTFNGNSDRALSEAC